MTMAPHVAEELATSELCANLRIIAHDAPKLTATDRNALIMAATELEVAYRMLLLNHETIDLMHRHAEAQMQRILELQRRAGPAPVLWSMVGDATGRLV